MTQQDKPAGAARVSHEIVARTPLGDVSDWRQGAWVKPNGV
jgi:hypothetical protein